MWRRAKLRVLNRQRGNWVSLPGKKWSVDTWYTFYVFPQFFDTGAVGGVSLFNYLFICWSSKMTVLWLCYYAIALCTSKGGLSVSVICHLWWSLYLIFHYEDILFYRQSVVIQATTECYISLQSVWQGDPKMCRSGRLMANSRIILIIFNNNSRIISDNRLRAWHALHENEAISSKN